MRRLVQIVATYPFGPGAPRPRVLLVAPPVITEPATARTLDCFVGAASESRNLAGLYRNVAGEQGCEYFDAGTVCHPSSVDGVHLDADNTRAIGLALAPIVQTVLCASL